MQAPPPRHGGTAPGAVQLPGVERPAADAPNRRLPGRHRGLHVGAVRLRERNVTTHSTAPVGQDPAIRNRSRGLLQQPVGDHRQANQAPTQLVAIESGGRELGHEHGPIVIGHGELHERVIEIGTQHPGINSLGDLHGLEPIVCPQGAADSVNPRHGDPQVETSQAVDDDIPAQGIFRRRARRPHDLEAELTQPAIDRRRLVAHDADAAEAAKMVVPDSTRCAPPKSRSITPGSIRQLRPTSTPSGTRARFPTNVMPAYRRSGSSRLGGVSSPIPTTAPAPMTASLSTIARSSTAPSPMTASNITIESRTTAPAATRTPGERTLCSTVPSMTQPWLTMDRATFAVGPIRAGGRSSLLV